MLSPPSSSPQVCWFVNSCDFELVLTASLVDQVVAYRGTIREKPETEEDCRTYLKSYETEPACTVTAVVVSNSTTGKRVFGVDVARQWFTAIPEDVVAAVIAKGEIMQCAGGFMIDDAAFAAYLGAREGSEDSIIGMPLALTMALVQQVQCE